VNQLCLVIKPTYGFPCEDREQASLAFAGDFDHLALKSFEGPSGDQDLIAFGDVDLDGRFFSAARLKPLPTSARGEGRGLMGAGRGRVPPPSLPNEN